LKKNGKKKSKNHGKPKIENQKKKPKQTRETRLKTKETLGKNYCRR
jgi:hypothetical protein